MRYEYDCYTHGAFEIEAPIDTGPPSVVYCPQCHEGAMRNYVIPPIHFHTQGFHATDYDKHGDKLERLNKQWSKETGEAPPPPAKDVPKNSSDPY